MAAHCNATPGDANQGYFINLPRRKAMLCIAGHCKAKQGYFINLLHCST